MPKNPDLEKYNPCLKEQNMTYKCLNDNNYDREICTVYMENYKSCKAFWNDVQAQRRRDGIVPYLPPIEERAKIKAEVFSQHNINVK